MLKQSLPLALALAAVCLPAFADGAARQKMIAKYTAAPVVVDGVLDDAAWQDAQVYPLYLGLDAAADGTALREAGEARIAWDNNNFYLGIRYTDSDIVQLCNHDQAMHYETGDLAELFLKPAGSTWYWELYVMPNGTKTSLWFPGAGHVGLPSALEYKMLFSVDAHCEGTLNDWKDKDTAWTGEMAVPIEELTRYGDDFGPGAAWTMLVGRYNYARYLPKRGPELSMTPQLPVTNYHDHAGYAALVLEK